MALPVVIAKNQTGSPIELPRLGLTAPASPGTITLTDFSTFFEIAAEEVLDTNVASGDIVINDGNSDLSIADGLAFLNATGNMNGPTSGLAANVLVKLADTTGRYTDATGITVDGSDNMTVPGTINVTSVEISGTPLSLTDLSDTDVSGSVHGDILFYNGTDWENLAPGTSGQVLETQGSGADPQWAAAGTGDVTAGANITDNRIVRGDGGAKGIQDSGWTIDDSDIMTVPGLVSGNLLTVDPTSDMVLIEGSTPNSDFLLTLTQNLSSGEFLRTIDNSSNTTHELRMDPSGSSIFRMFDDAGNNNFEWEAGQLTLDGTGTVTTDLVPETDYCVTIRGPADGNGIFINCGDDAGTISLNIADADSSFQIWQLDADTGELAMGDSLANIRTANGTVYGMDNQYSAGDPADFNTGNGGYRVQQELIIDNSANLDTFAGSLTGTINGHRHYGASGTDPVSPTPVAGDRYYNTTLEVEMRYDGTRSKWLSVETAIFQFGRSGATAPGSFYRLINGLTMSTTIGYNAFFDGTIVGLAYTRSDTDSATFELLAGGSQIHTLNSTALKAEENTVDADFSQSDVLSVRNLTGLNTTSNVAGWIRVKWRA